MSSSGVKRSTHVEVISVEDCADNTKPVPSMRPLPIHLCTILLDTENTAKPIYADARVCISTAWTTHHMSDVDVEPWTKPKYFLEMDDW
jgi:hypothetical protein